MQQTFFQKVIITIVAGFFAAIMVYFFEHVFDDANSVLSNSATNNSSMH